MVPLSTTTETPEIIIGVLGQDGHGKTSLTAAITQSLARQNGDAIEGNEIVVDLGERQGEDQSRPFVYETEARRYTHIDCHNHIDVMKNLILNRIPLHGAILVVSAVEGITDQTKEQVRLANIAGVSAIVVFLNKCDLTNNAEFLEQVEQDVRNLLLAHGYADDDLIIRGSATAALNSLEAGVFDLWASKIRELLDALDASIPAPQRLEDRPFLMQVEETFTIPTKGTVVIGLVERGSYKTNSYVEIVGLRPMRTPIGTSLEQSHKGCDTVYPGASAGMLLRGLDHTGAQPGQVLAAPGTIRAYGWFHAVLYLLSQRENGNDRPDLSGTSYAFFFRNIEIDGSLQCEVETNLLREGDLVRVTIELENVIAMEQGQRFALRQNGRSLGYGIVTELLS